VSLAQLIGTMHDICKVWGANPDYHKKKIRNGYVRLFNYNKL